MKNFCNYSSMLRLPADFAGRRRFFVYSVFYPSLMLRVFPERFVIIFS